MVLSHGQAADIVSGTLTVLGALGRLQFKLGRHIQGLTAWA